MSLISLFNLGTNMFGLGSTQRAPETPGVSFGPVRMDIAMDLMEEWPNLKEKIRLALENAGNKELSLSDRVSSYSEACNHLATLVEQIYDRALDEKKSWNEEHNQILRTQKQTTQNDRDKYVEHIQSKVNTTLAKLASELRNLKEQEYASLETCSGKILEEIDEVAEKEPIENNYWNADQVRTDAENSISKALFDINNLKVIRMGSGIGIT